MNKYIKILIFVTYSFFSPEISFSQTVGSCEAPYNTAESLVEILVGDGVEFSNVTFSGFECSAGFFSGPSNLDFQTGLVMATDGLESITPGFFGGGAGGAASDPDLEEQLQLVNALSTNLNNLIILEFDFVPISDAVTFNYIFASNEYTSYTCSQYNDIFGFFLSGPGINGPFTNNAENIALVPDPNSPGNYTTTPVIINTVNSGTPSGTYPASNCSDIDPNWQDYSVFYTANPDFSTLDFATIGYPGFASLNATANVTPCLTYHMKLAIADVSDGGVNSAVFLQENSFSSTSPSADFQSEFSPWSGNDTTLVEGCFDGTLSFEIDEALDIDYVINFDVTGSATEGVDFQTMGNQVIIPSGDTEATIPLVPFYDGIVEGDEFLSVNVTLSDGCEEQEYEFNFTIVDRLPMYMDSLPDTSFCPGDLAIDITPYISGGIAPMTYQWLYNGLLLTNQQNITIQPENLGNYSFSANGLCDSEVSDSFETYLLEPDLPLTILAPYNSIEVCLGDELSTLIQISGGIGEPSYMWYMDGSPYNDTLNFDFSTDFPYDYDLEFRVEDECSNFDSDNFVYNIVYCGKPNVFTPNADGLNDFLYINFGDVVDNVRIDIYNRWGQMVYTSINYELCDELTGKNCWDGVNMSNGEPATEGSYHYTIELLDGRKHRGFFNIFRE